MIAVIDIPTRTLVEVYDASPVPDPALTSSIAETRSFQCTDNMAAAGQADRSSAAVGMYFQAVAVAPDGQTVLTADYYSGFVHVFTMDYSTGHLTYVNSIDVSNEGILWPVNVSISPNGQTAIVAEAYSDIDHMVFAVLNIASPGVVTLADMVTPVHRLEGCQSVVFNQSGTRAYSNCTPEWPAPQDEGTEPNNVIVTLNIDPTTGAVTDSGAAMEVNLKQTDQFFGVDTLALDPSGRYLFVSNPSVNPNDITLGLPLHPA